MGNYISKNKVLPKQEYIPTDIQTSEHLFALERLEEHNYVEHYSRITITQPSIEIKDINGSIFYPNVYHEHIEPTTDLEWMRQKYDNTHQKFIIIEIIRDNKVKLYRIPKRFIIRIYKTNNKENNKENNNDAYVYYIHAQPLYISLIPNSYEQYIKISITTDEANILIKHFGIIET